MNIMRSLHTAILVTDLEKAVNFYENVLGLTRIDRPFQYDGVWYQVGDYQIHLIDMLDQLQTQLYHLEQYADRLVTSQLTHLSFVSIAVIFLAGLLTSLTPCMLSMLPITVAYIGGYENKGRLAAFWQSTWFSLGLATTLAGLGLIAATLGKVYGQVGIGLPIIVSAIAILMGLNLLELLPLRFPSLGATDWITGDFPPILRSYLLGLTFGLIASPCSTPVLATCRSAISNYPLTFNRYF